MNSISIGSARAGLLLLVLFSSAELAGQMPPQMTPAQVGINYDIVACRMPVAGNEDRDAFPDAVNFSLYVGRGTELVVIHPDGSETLLHSAGPNGACVDPCVSFDGQTIYFTKFVDPENINPQRGVSWSPAHVWKLDVATQVATQLTFGTQTSWQETAHAINPQYSLFDVAPTELPDGRILFLSNRDAAFGADWIRPAMRFWRMHADGTNLEQLEAFSQTGCQHPHVLKDGRIVWTHHHPAGRRDNIQYPLFVANPDLSHEGTFAGAHYQNTAFHFVTQMANDDLVVCAYYHQNNYGHGTFLRFPLDPGDPSSNLFHPANQSPSSNQWWNWANNSNYRRVGETVAAPWAMIWSPSYDESSPLLPDGTRAGKVTQPAAAPGGHLLFVWSHGNVNDLYRPTPELPHMKVCYAANGAMPNRNDLVVLKENAAFQYLYPKPVVPYQAIHGVPKPAVIPDTPNDGTASAILPAGSPFATTGTSSVYNRESRWPIAYQDPFDVNIVNNYAINTAFFNVGQDTFAFPNSAIHAAQVVVDMTRTDTRYGELVPAFVSHNGDGQLWGVLGEVPVRKFSGGGAPVLDPQGNPDTSYEVRIPAHVPFHHRLIDSNGITLTSEWTWHSTRPGERKNDCGGCHAHSINSTPLSFATTAAAQPAYVVQDFALQRPMIDQDAGGSPIVTVFPDRARLFEFHRDVKPIFVAKCVSCHGNVNPAGNLDLQGNDAWDALAFDDASNALIGPHQRTRWVRTHAASQSLLAWKAFGARLDGRTNADRPNDVDYTGTAMPPPASGVPPLTFQEKRAIALWIDLGCLVDLTPGADTLNDPFDDQMRPTLVLGGIHGGYNALPAPPLTIGAYDLHSGIDPASLSVVVTPSGGAPGSNLAAGVSITNGQTIAIGLPALPSHQSHTVQVSVKDLAGNKLSRKVSFMTLPPAGLATTGPGTPGTGGLVPTLGAAPLPRIGTPDFAITTSQARANATAWLFASPALASPPLVAGGGAVIHLDLAQLVGGAAVATGATDSSGTWAWPAAIPDAPALAGVTVHLQAVVQDPMGAAIAPGFVAALTPAVTVAVGW